MTANQPFEPIVEITAKPLLLPQTDIDTDQILPARFLTTTSRDGLGDKAFYDWRRDAEGRLIDEHILNRAARADRRILVAGRNFGCGSSREHAPWALYDYGVRIILSSSLADIFRNNALKNGIAAIEISEEAFDAINRRPNDMLTVNIRMQTLSIAGAFSESFELEPMAKTCLMSGEDQLGLLLAEQSRITAFERDTGK